MNSVLVVCEANICRSPMAEALLAAGLPGIRVRSAGLNALVGNPADEMAVALMCERGIDISRHRATQISRALCVESDVILIMEREQRQRLQQLYPEICGRVYRLAEDADRDVPDPYRKPREAFRASLSLIEESTEHWLRRIRRL